jgi:hypothetical protein
MDSSHARIRMARWCAGLLLVLLAATWLPAAGAQNTLRYFGQTGHYLRGAFRSFWERNGGVANFGYPLTEEYYRGSDGRIVQFFERARFELLVQGNQAIIELGRLGVETTGNKIFPKTPPFTSTRARRYFPETEHSLQGAFKATWEARGGLRIFGNPISEEIAERLSDGRFHTVQYFERARFELWPGGVLIGHLGRELAPAQLLERWPPEVAPPGPLNEDGTPRPPASPPPPPPAPPPTQRPPPGDSSKLGILIHDILVPRGNGSITPLAAPPGVAFTFTAGGFDPAEPVGVWLTRPDDGGVEAIDSRLVALDGKGNVRVIFGTESQAEGVWLITGQGVTTGRSVTAPFKLTRDYVAPPGTPRPANRGGSVSPAEGGRRTTFQLTGSGFRANEDLQLWITSPDGIYYLAGPVRADSRGRIGFNPGLLVQFGAQNTPGVYGYHYRGTRSGARVDLYFTFTGAA